MAQIELRNVTFYYDDYYHPIFENLNVSLNTDWKMALVGRNGRGKTTMLKLLEGSLEVSAGEIKRAETPVYFPYSYNAEYIRTLDVIKECIAGLKTLEVQMNLCEGDSCKAEKYFKLLERYADLGGYDVESRIYKELAEIGLEAELLERDFFTLSGGEQTCMLVIALFLRKDAFVLLDEPTNHLDKEKKELLKQYLKRKKGYIIASHDAFFLDAVTDHIFAINKSDITIEQGNYSTWRRNMELKEHYELRTKQRLMQEISQLERQSKLNREWSDIGNKQKYPFRPARGARTNGTKAYVRHAKAAEQHIRDNLEEKKQLLRNLEEEKQLSIYQEILESECLIALENGSYRYNESKPIFENLTIRIYPGDKLWIRGRNGAGKSTLLKLLSGKLQGKDVRYKEGISIAYVTQEPEWKCGDVKRRLQENMKDGEDFETTYMKFKELCNLFDLPEDFESRPLETLSGGERRKVDVARALCGNHQVLFLDEPLNYMDVYFKEQMERALADEEMTVVFVEHNEEFGRRIANKELEL